MLKKLLLSLIAAIGFTSLTAQKCFVNTDITNSQTLFTYQGNVYDITNYNHPGGINTIKQTVGTALEPFVNQPRYSFHLTSGRFTRDLQNILVGVLKDICIPPVVPPVITTLPPVLPPVVTTVPPVITTVPPVLPPVVTTVPPVLPPVVTTVPPVVTTLPPVVTTVSPVITTLAPNPVTDATLVAPSLPVNCKLFNFNSIVPYNQQNIVAEVNPNNIAQDNTYITLGLIQNIGGSRIAMSQTFQYGRVDATIKASKGLNVVTGFYIEADTGDIVNLNIIQNQDNKNSIIETNFFYNGNYIYNANAQYHETSIVLSDTFNTYSIVWFPTYYEWRLNDILLRTLNMNDTDTFPNSPSRVKLSIWEGPTSTWAGTGIQWIQGPFSSVLSSLSVNCNQATNYSDTVKNSNSTDREISNSAVIMKLTFSIYMIFVSFIIFMG